MYREAVLMFASSYLFGNSLRNRFHDTANLLYFRMFAPLPRVKPKRKKKRTRDMRASAYKGKLIAAHADGVEGVDDIIDR